MNNLFTRQEIIKLSGLTRGQLSYLDDHDLIKPIKIGSIKKPHCLYSWSQLISLRAYARLREKCSLQSLREVINYLNLENLETLIADKRLILLDNNQFVWLINDIDTVMGYLVSGSNKGQVIVSFTYEDLKEDIVQNADNVVNFEDRFKNATKAA